MIRILLVDDEQLMLNLTKEFLEQQEEDFEVDTAISAEEALQRLSEEEYDVVVSDYKMPEMDGLEFLSRLRGQGNNIPFIMFTGKGREEVAVEAFVRGADGYVVKGGDPTAQYAELANWVKAAVSRRKAQNALKESEEKYRSLVEVAHDGIVVTEGVERSIAFTNSRMVEMLGYTIEDLIGKSYRDFVHPDDREDYRTRRGFRLVSGKADTRERRFIRKDGSTLYTLLSVSSINPEDRTESAPAICIFTDITERKKMEQAVREGEGRLLSIIENLGAGLAIADRNTIITYANPRLAEMLGYTPEEIMGKHGRSFVHKDSLAERDTDYAERKKGVTSTIELNLAAKDGRPIPVMKIGTPIFDEKGEFNGSYSIIIDLTEHKKMEDRERFLRSLLRHDLRNKLQSVYGYLELLRRTGLKGKQEEYAENLGESAQDAVELIEQIQELRSIEEAKETVDVDLDLAIRDAITDLSADAEEQGIAINYKGTPGAVVRANPILKNTFTNLIGNSIRHANCKQIQITVRELKDRYRITVKDDGKSIPKSVREKLFERGTKGTGSTGSGLGLHLVKRIIETSEGTIELKDTKKGTRFDIYLKKATILRK